MFKAPRAGPTSHITRLPNYLGGVLARRRCESYGTFIIPHKDNNGTYGDGVGPIPKGH
jgi:hypothetical protein